MYVSRLDIITLVLSVNRSSFVQSSVAVRKYCEELLILSIHDMTRNVQRL